MKRLLLGAITMAPFLALTSFVQTSPKAVETTKIIRHEGQVTYVWEMNGSEVVGVTTFALEQPGTGFEGWRLAKRHYAVNVEGK